MLICSNSSAELVSNTHLLPSKSPSRKKKKSRHYPPSFMQNIYIHTYIFIYTHTYTQHLREGRDYFHCYRNWGIKNPSVSKAGAAPDVKSLYWLEQLTLFLCGRPQRLSQAAKAHQCNSIYRRHEVTRPVPAWFPVNAEAQNTPSTFAHTTKGGNQSPMTVKPWNCLEGGSSAPTHRN